MGSCTTQVPPTPLPYPGILESTTYADDYALDTHEAKMTKSKSRDRAELPPEPISVPTDCHELKKPDGGARCLTSGVSEKFSESLVGD